MAVAHVQAVASVGGASGAHLAITPTTGNILIAGALTNLNAGSLTISDTAGNTWTPISANVTDGATTIRSWWAKANGSSSTTVTFVGAGGTFFALFVDEFSGQDPTTPISGHNEASGSGSPTVNVTPTDNNCALWGFVSDSVTAVGSGFTKGGDDASQDWSEWKILSGGSGVAQTVNFTGSGSYVIGGVAIKPPAGTFVAEDDSYRVPRPQNIEHIVSVW